MKCTQEQWDSIKDRIPKNKINSVSSFKIYPYLINFDDEKIISNISKNTTWIFFWEQRPEIHETVLKEFNKEKQDFKITKL